LLALPIFLIKSKIYSMSYQAIPSYHGSQFRLWPTKPSWNHYLISGFYIVMFRFSDNHNDLKRFRLIMVILNHSSSGRFCLIVCLQGTFMALQRGIVVLHRPLGFTSVQPAIYLTLSSLKARAYHFTDRLLPYLDWLSHSVRG
jgi:hypothetical protein